MQNNSSKNRLVKITAKVFIMLLAVVLSLSVLPAFSADILPSANADTVTYDVPSNATVAQINEKLESYAEGSVVNMKLYNNINLVPSSASTFTTGIVGIEIPKGITVNLFMNGYSILFQSEGIWQIPYLYAIHNKGTLNIYSGATDNPNSTVTSAITLTNQRTEMGTGSIKECAYANFEAIRNEGDITVNKNVNITVSLTLHYSKLDLASGNAKSAQVAVGSTGIHNTSTNANCVINSASIDTYAWGEGSHSFACDDDEDTDSVAMAYGIYGGNVTINGDANIKAVSKGVHSRGTTWGGNSSNGTAYITSVSYGIATSGDVKVYGGTITHGAELFNYAAVRSEGNGKMFLYSGGIYGITGHTPMLADGSIVTTNVSTFIDTDGADDCLTYRKGTVVTCSDMISSASDVVSNMQTHKLHQRIVPTSDVSKSNFLDESGNTYETEMVTGKNQSPLAINRGALAGTQRVHIVYRYWKDKNRNQIDTSVVGNDGNVGYSYKPLTDGTDIVSSSVILDGITDKNQFTKTVDSTIGYLGDGEPCNPYHWEFIGLNYKETAELFCDFNVTSALNKGTNFKNFNTSNPVNNRVPATQGVIYVFVDYAKSAATSIRAKVGSSDYATTTYTGVPVKASDIGLQILESGKLTDITHEYNVDFTDSKLLPLSFSYTGRNMAGKTETGASGELPVNAGTYEVTLHIADSTVYDKNPDTNKNRVGIEYKFTLVIEQAPALRGTLPESISLEYGTKLEQVLELNTYNAKGLVNNNFVNGSFTFANNSDAASYKDVAENRTVAIVWTPANSAEEQAWNYKTTTFNVTYTVTPAKLTIIPNSASVIYGNSDIAYGVSVNGLVANDNKDAVKADIANAMNYMILRGESFSSYVAGEVSVGSYVIRATFVTVPAVLDNYTYDIVYGEEYGKLTVIKRNITVEAAAAERYYSPDDFTVDVSFKIISGLFSNGEDISVLPTKGNLRVGENTAGEQIVTGINKQLVTENLVTGSASGNYNVEALVYNTGDVLKVIIKKAIPTVTTPVVSEMFYQNARKLGDIDLTGYTSSVAGSWQWVDEKINPTVNVATYKAQFVPADSVNYETKTADIAIKVKVTPVVISYTGTVSYGDNIPNITAYTYKADNDPTFSIDAVKTSGNITPVTTYYKGAPVVDGGYPVEISAPNFVDTNGNYSFTTSNGVINVTPRLITFTVQNVTATYGDNFAADASTVNVTYDKSLLFGSDTVTADGSEPTFRFVTDFNYGNNYAVGTYYIKATPAFAVSPNYKVATVDATLTVAKAELTIKANDITLEYGSAVPDVSDAYTLIGAKRGETINNILSDGEIRVSTNYIVGDAAGKSGLTVTVDDAYATINNYKVTLQNGTLTVIKATPNVINVPSATITHGQTLGDAVIIGGTVENSVEGTYVYNSPSAAPVYRAEQYTIYEATFIPSDSENYNTVTGIYIPLTVNRKPVTGKLAVTGIPMVGYELTVDTNGLDPKEVGVYTVTWYLGETEIETGAKLTLTNSHELEKITVKAVANAPYEGEIVYTTTVIAPKLTDVKTVLDNDLGAYFNVSGLGTVGYNAQQHSVELNRVDATASSAIFGGVTVKYNGSAELPKAAGVYAVTIDIATPDGIENMQLTTSADGKTVYAANGAIVYSPVANFAVGTLVIEKADYSVQILVPDKTYDGTVAVNEIDVVKETGAYGSDDVYFDTDSAVFRFASATVGEDIEVTNYKANLSGKASENYKLIVDILNDSKADIKKATLEVKVTPIEREYEEGNEFVDLSFEINSDTLAVGDDGFVYVDEVLVKGKLDSPLAGQNKNVTVSDAVLTGSKANNYELLLVNKDGESLKTGRLTVTIEKATTQYYPIPQVAELTYDSAKPLSEISLGDKRWAWASDVANLVPGAGTHKYIAIFTPDDPDNYATVEYEVEVKVKKAVVTVAAANFSVIYGDIEPTYYYTTTGLTGADSIKNSVDGYVLMNCSYTAGSNAGKYDIVLTGAFESDNYDFIYKNGTVTVNKRAAYVVAEPVSREYQKDNLTVDVKFSEITNLIPADVNTVKLSCGNNAVLGTIDNANAGIKNVTISASEMPTLIGGEVATNYELRLINTSVTVEIRKARIPGVILPTEGQVGYGQRLSTTIFITTPVGTEYGKFEMENPTSTPTQIGTFSDVYKVVFTPYESQNYATISEYITLKVVPSELNVFISFSGTAQVGKSLYVVVNNIPTDAASYLTYEWYRMDTPDDDVRNGYLVAQGADATSYQLTAGDTDKYIVCKVTTKPNAPYNCEALCATDAPIKEEVLTFWQKFINWIYKIISNITQIFGGML